MRKCKHMETIDFSECFHVNDECVEIISKETFHLQTLKLNGLQITDEALWSIKRHCKYLKVIFIYSIQNITIKLIIILLY